MNNQTTGPQSAQNQALTTTQAQFAKLSDDFKLFLLDREDITPVDCSLIIEETEKLTNALQALNSQLKSRLQPSHQSATPETTLPKFVGGEQYEARSKALEIQNILSAISVLSELSETFRLHDTEEHPLDAELIQDLARNGRITSGLNASIRHLGRYACSSAEETQRLKANKRDIHNHTIDIYRAADAIAILAELSERFRMYAAEESILDEADFGDLAADSSILGALSGAIEFLTESAASTAEWLAEHAIHRQCAAG